MIENIRKRMEAATAQQWEDGLHWYKDAAAFAQEMADTYGVTFFDAAAVIAHLSVGTSWQDNKRHTVELLRDGDTRHKFGAVPLGKARAVLAGSDIHATFSAKSHKTRSFYLNIIGFADVVTVDRHAVKAAGLDLGTWKSGDAKAYAAVSAAYAAVAIEYGIDAAQCQAIVWCQIRGTGQ